MPGGDESIAEIEYWKALAEERRIQVDQLQARLLAALEAIPGSHLERFIACIDGRQDGWMGQIRRLQTSAELQRDDIFSTLDDLWAEVAADRST